MIRSSSNLKKKSRLTFSSFISRNIDLNISGIKIIHTLEILQKSTNEEEGMDASTLDATHDKNNLRQGTGHGTAIKGNPGGESSRWGCKKKKSAKYVRWLPQSATD